MFPRGTEFYDSYDKSTLIKLMCDIPLEEGQSVQDFVKRHERGRSPNEILNSGMIIALTYGLEEAVRCGLAKVPKHA